MGEIVQAQAAGSLAVPPFAQHLRPSDRETRQLFVKMVNFDRDRTIVLDVTPADTIAAVKDLVYEKQGIPPECQKLSSRNPITVLKNNKTLADYKLFSVQGIPEIDLRGVPKKNGPRR